MSDRKELDRPNWAPLETRLCENGRPVSVCGAFMWMWRQDGIEFYKHIESRRYLLLDSEQRCWRQGATGFGFANFESESRRVTEWA